jgi:hypothetical protein
LTYQGAHAPPLTNQVSAHAPPLTNQVSAHAPPLTCQVAHAPLLPNQVSALAPPWTNQVSAYAPPWTNQVAHAPPLTNQVSALAPYNGAQQVPAHSFNATALQAQAYHLYSASEPATVHTSVTEIGINVEACINVEELVRSLALDQTTKESLHKNKIEELLVAIWGRLHSTDRLLNSETKQVCQYGICMLSTQTTNLPNSLSGPDLK